MSRSRTMKVSQWVLPIGSVGPAVQKKYATGFPGMNGSVTGAITGVKPQLRIEATWFPYSWFSMDSMSHAAYSSSPWMGFGPALRMPTRICSTSGTRTATGSKTAFRFVRSGDGSADPVVAAGLGSRLGIGLGLGTGLATADPVVGSATRAVTATPIAVRAMDLVSTGGSFRGRNTCFQTTRLHHL